MLPAAQHVRCRRTLARHFTLFPERAPMCHGNATIIQRSVPSFSSEYNKLVLRIVRVLLIITIR